MDIFGVLSMVGGLALFLYGMKAMGDGLAMMAGGKLEHILEKLTSKRILAVLLGAGVTAVIQSSSATTVMVVGFVNSGIMHLKQAVGIIMGANIGTTITSWLLSLAGIEGDQIILKLLKPSSLAPIMAGIGIVLIMTASEKNKKKDIGNILLGFAILMFGMEMMSSAVKPLADNEQFTGILTAFSNPILGLLAGAFLTAIIQSSSASVGILQALCISGVMSYSVAIPIIMGQNIGTCITALISSVGANKNAKRASMIHLYFNVIGTVVFMIVFYSIHCITPFDFMGELASASGIAVIHSMFNIGCAVLLYPFSDYLVKLATISVPDHVEKSVQSVPHADISLDDRFLEKPAFAMEICRQKTHQMAMEVKSGIIMAFDLLAEYNEDKACKVAECEERMDLYEDVLGSYLMKISTQNLSKRDSQTMSVLLHSISDLERMSDHAMNLQELAYKIKNLDKKFSGSAKAELKVLMNAVQDILEQAITIFEQEDVEGAGYVEPLEEVIDRLTKEIKNRHIRRLRKGKCTVELGIYLEDILCDLERISDHCSNIAVAMIEIHEDEFDTHAYMNQINKEEGSSYDVMLKKYEQMYQLPQKERKKKDES